MKNVYLSIKMVIQAVMMKDPGQWIALKEICKKLAGKKVNDLEIHRINDRNQPCSPQIIVIVTPDCISTEVSPGLKPGLTNKKTGDSP
jgi:hypothetical protein